MYKTSVPRNAGTSHGELVKSARKSFHAIQKMTPRRQAYVRSAYFKKDKVFVTLFWQHLAQKHPAEQSKRLKFYDAAIELIRHSNTAPETIFDRNNMDVLLHRFQGVTKDGFKFSVQIKEQKRTNRKDFMSVFPRK